MSSIEKCYPINLFGITIQFPYENPYNAQKAIMANACRAFSLQKNALLESPTGTGKSLALLASALAFQQSEYEKKPKESYYMPDLDEPQPFNGPVRVFYTSRTHQQLNQVVKEFKRLQYNPQMSFLASRSNLCLFEPVSKSNNVDYQCRSQRHNCPYAENGKFIPDDLRTEKFDIEDLKTYCKENVRCPFMIAREMAKEAPLIFCPYNYIISPQLREQLKLNLKNSIVIFDEAHNIEDVCRETAKFSVKRNEIEIMQKEIVQAINSPSENSEWLTMIKSHLEKILKIIQFIIEWMKERRSSRSYSNEDYLIEKDESIRLTGWGLNSFTWPDISESMQILIRPDKKTQSRLPDRLVLPLSRLHGTLSLIFKNNAKALDAFQIVCNFGQDEKNDELIFLCMAPSVVFKPIADQAHSVILSSGTMSPLTSFSLELGVQFDLKLSVNHIIDPNQVAAFTISSDPENSLKFTSSYKNMKENRDRTFISLGNLLERFLRVIPDGVLLFVQSHELLKQMIIKWHSTRIFNSLNAIKPLYYEDKSKDIKQQIEDYKNKIKTGCGGFFIGVCRGQLSEGIDFSDSQARAVIIFGIPYPSWNSAEVKLKIEYNDRHSADYLKDKLMKGSEWYESQAKRSLFQAVGRCIRHKNDYGSIILIDERYPSMMSSFPKWVQNSYTQTPSIEAIINKLVVFYSKMRKQFPVSTGTALNLNYPVVLTCAKEGCNEKAFELYKLNPKATMMIENQVGFLNLIGATEPQRCVFIEKNVRKESFAMQGENEWCPEDENAYRILSCRCGNVFGARVNSACEEDKRFIEMYWLIPSSLIVQQGNNQQPLMMVMKTENSQNSSQQQVLSQTSEKVDETAQKDETTKTISYL